MDLNPAPDPGRRGSEWIRLRSNVVDPDLDPKRCSKASEVDSLELVCPADRIVLPVIRRTGSVVLSQPEEFKHFITANLQIS